MGKFKDGATVIIKDKNGRECNRGLTTGGKASVAIDETTCAIPLIIEAGIHGDKYYDERLHNEVAISGVGIHAVLPDATNTNVGVTALTEIAAGGLITASGVTATSAVIAAQNNSIASLLTNGKVTDPLAVPGAAASGVPATDAYGAALATLANLGSGANDARKVAKDLADDLADGTWDGKVNGVAVTTPSAATFGASMVAATTAAQTELSASAVAAAPSFNAYVQTPPSSGVAAAITAQATIYATKAADAQSLLNEMTSVGVYVTHPGYVDWLGNTIGMMSRKITATLSGGVYQAAEILKELVNGVWNTLTAEPASQATYVLTATGWKDVFSNPPTFSVNADGTVNISEVGRGTSVGKIVKVDIPGQSMASSVPAFDASGMMAMQAGSSVISASAVEPAGAAKYQVWGDGNEPSDVYELWAGNPVTGTNNATLTSLAAIGSTVTEFCANGLKFVTTTAGSADVYYASWNQSTMQYDCSVAANPTLKLGSMTSQQVTVNGQTIFKVTNVTEVQPNTLAGWFPVNTIIGEVNGKVLGGQMITAGPIPGGVQVITTFYNKTANDALMNAAGFAAKPY